MTQTNAANKTAAETTDKTTDSSGYVIFNEGELGEAHVMAHRALDEGRLSEGREMLGRWLEGRTGSGSDWVHVQWHMAVFEIAAGDWHAASARFAQHVLPAAIAGDEALTDAPALMWRLEMAAPSAGAFARAEHAARSGFAWQALRLMALDRMAHGERPSAFVELHLLMCLAGARDVDALTSWIEARSREVSELTSMADYVLLAMARGLLAYARGETRRAATLLARASKRSAVIGGSRAQNEMFGNMSRDLSAGTGAMPTVGITGPMPAVTGPMPAATRAPLAPIASFAG